MKRPGPHPRLTLVLGSGGIRSMASLGVARALWREGLVPDLVVGCSAGAVFGAALCHWNDPQEAIRATSALWTREITAQKRRGAIARMLWPRLGRFNQDFSLRDDREIRQRLTLAFGDTRIEELPIPLRVCATDADAGQCCALTRGALVPALRASIAMPFLFAPQLIDGRRYVDGFASDPLPVAAASDAQCVIAVGFGVPMPQRVNSPNRLLARTTATMINNLMQARLDAACAQRGNIITLFPEFERRVGLFDTHAMDHVVKMGEQAAERILERLHERLAQASEPLPALAQAA